MSCEFKNGISTFCLLTVTGTMILRYVHATT